MRKRIISLLVSILLLINCIYPAVSFASESDMGKMIFKYYDVENGTYLDNGENLKIGSLYDIEICTDNMTNLFGGPVPIHFNSDVVKVVSYNDNTPLEDEDIIPVSPEISSYFVCNTENWPIRAISGEGIPFISNRKGLIVFDFRSTSNKGKDVTQATKMFSFRVQAVSEGQINVRPATIALDGTEGSFVLAPNGPEFTRPGGDIIDYEIVNDDKYAVYGVTGVMLEETVVDVLVENSVLLNATVTPDNAANKNVFWSSENDKIATVDQNGLVTGISVGNTTITVTTEDGSFIDTCEVNVLDINTPTRPQNLAVVMQTAKSVKIRWSESTGKNGVSGYNIYRNGEKIGATSSDVCVYEDVDASLVTGEEYTYVVEAFYNDITSLPSDELKVILTAPEIIKVTPENQKIFGATTVPNFKVYLSSITALDGATVKMEYSKDNSIWSELYSGDFSNTNSGTDTQTGYKYFSFDIPADAFIVTDGEGNEKYLDGEYYFKYTVTDKSGAEGTYQVIYTVVAPPVITNFHGATVAPDYGAPAYYLDWEAPSAYITKYYLHIGGNSYTIDNTYGNGYPWIGEWLSAGRFDIEFYAVDSFGQTTPEPIKTSIVLEPFYYDPYAAIVSPADNTTISGVQKLKYEVGYGECDFLYSTDGGSTWNEFYRVGTDYEWATYSGEIDFDTSGITSDVVLVKLNIDSSSKEFSKMYTYFIDNSGPHKVQNVTAGAGSTSVELSWDAVKADDLYYYIIEKKLADGSYEVTGSRIYDICRKTITELTPQTTYTFRVVAYDRSGNRGVPSDDCVVTTLKDSEKPEILSITPNSKKIADNIQVIFNATDNYKVKGAKIQVSTDLKNWSEKTTINASTPAKNAALTYNLKVADFNDGLIYVRAVPFDEAGNYGDESTVPYVRYLIDTTAPKAPEVSVTSYENRIELSWKNAETDIAYYIVERKVRELFGTETKYVQIGEKLTTAELTDTDVTGGNTYIYRIKAVDDVGNESPWSSQNEAMTVIDEIIPEVTAIVPATGSYISNNSTITVYAKDNVGISSIELYYRIEGSLNERTLGSVENKEMASFNLSKLGLSLQNKNYVFSAIAYDTTGNESKAFEVTYMVDNTKPQITITDVVTGIGSAEVKWTSTSDDVKSYKVEYAEQGSTVYRSAGTVTPTESAEYSKKITGLSASKTYVIRITATDKAGNTASALSDAFKVEANVIPEVVYKPEVEIVAESTSVVNSQHKFSVKKLRGSYDIVSYSWDFGDATTSIAAAPVHAYSSVGTYKVSLTVKDSAGNEATNTMEIKVVESVEVLTVVVNDINNNPIPNASVLFNNVTYRTDKSGKTEIRASAGNYTFTAYASGYLSVQKSIVVEKKVIQDVITVNLTKKDVLISKIKWNRMTVAELKNAGINANDYTASSYYKYEVTLALKNARGNTEYVTVKGFKYLYDESPIVISSDVIGNRTTNGSGVFTNNTMYIYDFTPENIIDGYEYDSTKTSGQNSAPYVAVVCVEIPSEATWVGEEFNIMLTAFNQADSSYVLEDCYVNLSGYPQNAMSVSEVNADGAVSGMSVNLGEIFGQESKSVTWVMRGDRSGEYYVNAEFHGALRNNDAPVDIYYQNSKPIIIYGNESLSYIVEYEDEIKETDDYMIRVGLKNKSIIPRDNETVSLIENHYEIYSEETKETYTVSVEAVDGFTNYIESPLGARRYISGSSSSAIYFNEILYSNYIIHGLKSIEDIRYLVPLAADGNLSVSNPLYKKVKSHSFHERSIDIYKDKNKTNIISVHAGDEVTFSVKVTERYPDRTTDASPDGTKIYMNDELIGATKDGVVEYTYTVPEDAENTFKLTFKGNRTSETGVTVKVAPKKTLINGFVHDKFGNPIKGAKVSIADPKYSTETNKSGKFEFEELISAETITIEVSKNKYKTVTEEVKLTPGSTTLNFTMERLRSKPKVVSVTPTYLGKRNKDIIIPQGLQTTEFFTIKGNISDGTIDKYRLEKVSENGVNEVLNESEYSTVALETAKLKAGDTISVIAVSGDVESDPYELPVTVIEAPFVHLLNNREFVVESGEMNGQFNFSDLTKKIPDKNGTRAYWLSDTAWDEWDDLLGRFSAYEDMEIPVDDAVKDTNTSLYVDWFAEDDFYIYVTYDFESGELHISQLPNGNNNEYYYQNNSSRRSNKKDSMVTGYMELEEKIDTNASFHYGYLKAYDTMDWDIESEIDVYFELNDDETGWDGEFELIADEYNTFHGTYYRNLEKEKNIVPFDIPDYLEGKFNKTVEVDTDVVIPLSDVESSFENGQGGNAFPINYTSYTSGSWDNGIGKIMLSTQSSNTVYPLNNWRGEGYTATYGNYYLFGYSYPIYTREDTYREYDTVNTSDVSLFGMDIDEAVFEPIPMYESSAAVSDTSAIKDGVFANTEAAMLDGENPVLIYLDTDTSRTAANQSMLVSSEYNSTSKTWGTPVAVENDGTGDYNPEITSTQNGAVAVWANAGNVPSNDSFCGLSEEEIAANIASQIDISAAVYSNGTWINTTSLNKSLESANTFNYAPAVTAFEEGAIAVWINNPENNMTGYDRNDTIRYSVFNGTEWSEDQPITTDSFNYGAIADVKLVEKDGMVYMLFASEQEDTHESGVNETTGETTYVTEVFKKYYLMTYNGSDWSVVKSLNNDVYCDSFADFVEVDGKIRIVTVSNMTMYCYDAVTREILIEEHLDSKINGATEYSAATDGNNIAIVWITCESDGQKIYSALYDSEIGMWSDAVELVSVSKEYIIKNIVSSFVGSELLTVYNKYQYNTSTGEVVNVMLCDHSQSMNRDLALDSVELNDAVVTSGTEAHFTAQVTNTGLNQISGFKIVYSDATGAISGEYIVNGTIAGGKTEKYDFTCVTGEINTNLVVNATIVAAADNNASNDSATCNVIVENTEITNLEFAQTSDDNLFVNVSVKNSGTVPVTRDINLMFNGNTLTQSTELMNVDETKVITFALDDIKQTTEFTAEIDLTDSLELFKANKSVTDKFVPVGVSFKAMITPFTRTTTGITSNLANNSLLQSVFIVKQDDEIEIEKSIVSEDDVAALADTDNSKEFEIMLPVDESNHTYELVAPGLLTRQIEPSKFNNSEIKLFAGDFVTDKTNSINAVDLGAVIELQGAVNDDEAYKSYYDFNNDGVIDGNELGVVLSNYNVSSLVYQLLDMQSEANNN